MAEVYQGPCQVLSPQDLAWLGTPEQPGSGAFTPNSDLLTFSMRDVQPTVGQFVAGADSLRFRVFTTLASATVFFRGRYLLPIGNRSQLIPFAQNVTATSGSAGSVLQLVQNDGFVAQLAASVTDDTIQSGDVYAIVEAGRVESGTFQVYQQMLAGYVTVRFPVVSSDVPAPPATVPTGRQLIEVPAAAAGAQITYTIPAGQIWKPISVFIRFEASSQVATREVHLKIDDGRSAGGTDFTGVYMFIPMPHNITANQNWSMTWIRQLGDNYANLQGQNWVAPLGELLLKAGDRIRSSTINTQTNDVHSVMNILTEVSSE